MRTDTHAPRLRCGGQGNLTDRWAGFSCRLNNCRLAAVRTNQHEHVGGPRRVPNAVGSGAAGSQPPAGGANGRSRHKPRPRRRLEGRRRCVEPRAASGSRHTQILTLTVCMTLSRTLPYSQFGVGQTQFWALQSGVARFLQSLSIMMHAAHTPSDVANRTRAFICLCVGPYCFCSGGSWPVASLRRSRRMRAAGSRSGQAEGRNCNGPGGAPATYDSIDSSRERTRRLQQGAAISCIRTCRQLRPTCKTIAILRIEHQSEGRFIDSLTLKRTSCFTSSHGLPILASAPALSGPKAELAAVCEP